jgi:hypothetical protein
VLDTNGNESLTASLAFGKFDNSSFKSVFITLVDFGLEATLVARSDCAVLEAILVAGAIPISITIKTQ